MKTIGDLFLCAWWALIFFSFSAALYVFGGKDARRELRGDTDEDAEGNW